MKYRFPHVDFLDALRGIAVLGVVLCHTYAEVYGYGSELAPWKGWFRCFSDASNVWMYPLSWGRAGVAIFFVISGFCIHTSYHQSQKLWGAFFIRRFFRLYPAYITALIFVMTMIFICHFTMVIKQGFFWSQFSSHAFLVHNFFSSTFKGINPALWSLAVEVQLYIVYPLLLRLVAKLGWCGAMVILAAFELVLQGGASWVMMTGSSETTLGHILEIASNTPFGYWFSWGMGAWIADAYIKHEPLPFLKIHPLIWFSAAAGTDFIKPLQPYWFICFALTSAGLISRQLNAEKPGLLSFIFSRKALIYVGLWSYSLYLLHYPLLEVYLNLVDWFYVRTAESRPTFLLCMIGTWATIIPLSMLWYNLIELPGIALGKRFTSKMPTEESRQKEKAGNSTKPSKSSRIKQPKFVAKAYAFCMILLATMIIGNIMAGARFAPTALGDYASKAWSYATDPDPAKRDGALAVKYAERACRQTGFSQPNILGVFAASLAEASRFDEAINVAQYACKLAQQNGDTQSLQMNQSLLQLYANHQAYHLPLSTPPATAGNQP